jgi:hypothetical protein
MGAFAAPRCEGVPTVREYVVYRHGHADANQSAGRGQPEKMAVARVTADGPEEACRLARPQVTLAAGQYLTAEPAADVDAKEHALNRSPRTLHSMPSRPEPE